MHLKPCYNCGSNKLIVTESVQGWLVWCTNCFTEGRRLNPKEAAIAWWNTRYIEDALEARVAELEAAYQDALTKFNAQSAEVDRLRDENVHLRNALEFYANANYHYHLGTVVSDPLPNASYDLGWVARKALARKDE